MRKVKVVKFESVEFMELAAHTRTVSKTMIDPREVGSKFGLRVSILYPGGSAEMHSHREIEHCFFVLKGSGVLIYDDDIRATLEPNTCAYVPPGVKHALLSTGLEPLVLIVINAPTHPEYLPGDTETYKK
jgi:mannose-6-phosphate isomerase-like protein (cupin superfamily)